MAALIVVGGVEVSTGAGTPLGVAKITLGFAGWTTAIADVSQGTQDIEFGWNGDSTTPNSNFIRDTLFGGNGKSYDIVSSLIGAVGLYTGFVNYPMLASTSATALIPGRGTQGNALINNDARAISRMSKKQLKSNLPDGWTYTEHNGRVHIKDANGNLLDLDGNIVSRKSPDGHIPYKSN